VARRRKEPWWADADTEELLDTRICDLGVSYAGTWVERAVEKAKAELDARGLVPRPTFWLAAEWLSPDASPGVGVAFYLAHPRLMRLERQQMLEVEGGTREECLKLLRHELGHVMQTAYRLHLRRAWRQLFGSVTKRYPEFYRPNPASRKFVQHLPGWYAQSHPAEDFAETFAVWLTPRSDWRQRYQGWRALRKLEYVDELMRELQGVRPTVRSRARPFSVSQTRFTLRSYYRRKREHYAVGFTDAYDRDLKRLFDAPVGKDTAAKFLRRNRSEIRDVVVRWTGEYTFAVDHLMKEMIGRCQELKLRSRCSVREKWEFAILLTMHSMSYVLRGREWHAV